jgi:predicted transcriptional regulator
MDDNPKQTAIRMIEDLPEDASYEDIMYHLYVLEAIEQGLDDVDAGRVVSQKDVEKKVSKWLKSSGR